MAPVAHTKIDGLADLRTALRKAEPATARALNATTLRLQVCNLDGSGSANGAYQYVAIAP